MLTDDVRIISVDDHVVEPAGVWTDRLPKKYLEAGPHVVELPDKVLAWEYEGKQWLFEMVGSPQTQHFRKDGTGDDLFARHYDDLIPACFEPAARVEAMDEDGIWAELCFPTFPRFAGTRFLKGRDKDLALLCIRAYNDWMVDEWCAAAPERFIPLVLLPLWDPGLCVAEIERTAAKGAKAISFPETPVPLKLPSFWTDHWDPVLAAAQAAAMPLCMHIGTSGSLFTPSPESTEEVAFSLASVHAMSSCADMIFGGVFERFPNLHLALSEAGGGWVPYLMERMDYVWQRWRKKERLAAAPSQTFHDHVWTCVIEDEAAIDMRHRIGVDRLLVESDFPHQDGNWPNTRKVIADMLQAVPDDEARQIAEANARSLFSLS